MEQKGLRTGHFLALAGALAAFASLWRPWYSVELGDAMQKMFGVDGLGRDPGLMGEMSRGLASAMPSTVQASGWEVLEGADVAITVAAVAVVALVLGAAGGSGPPTRAVRVDGRAAGHLIAGLGALSACVVVFHLVEKPGAPLLGDESIHVLSGVWVALAGAMATFAGGIWAARDAGARSQRTSAPPLSAAFPPLTPELPPVFAQTPHAAASSVAPPRA